MKAIETHYKGYRFRSRLEARWAVFFDALGVKWEYEKEGYDLGEAGWYLPDFWLPDFGIWIEIKGEISGTDDEFHKIDALYKATGHHAFIACGSIDDHKWMPDMEAKREDILHDGLHQRTITGTQSSFCFNSFRDLDENGDGFQIKCPVCRFEYVHFADAQNVDGEDSGKAWRGRGDAIKIPMYCESGHHWTLRIGFHKGWSFMGIEDVWESVDDIGFVLAKYEWTDYEEAVKKAKSARFEHGENGARP